MKSAVVNNINALRYLTTPEETDHDFREKQLTKMHEKLNLAIDLSSSNTVA